MTDTGKIIGIVGGVLGLGIVAYFINKGVKKQRNRQDDDDSEKDNAIDNKGGTRRNRYKINKSRRR